MAHNLNVREGKVSMVYQGQTPWHSLGFKIDPGMTPSAARNACGMETFEVSKELLYLSDGHVIPNHRAIVSDRGDVLAVMGKDYEVKQYSETLSIADDLGLEVETAGMLGNGERAWIQMKLPSTVQVTPGDAIGGYLSLMSSHNGTIGIAAIPTTIRQVCENTTEMVLRSGVSAIRFRHTANVQGKIDEARKILDLLIQSLEFTGMTFRQLADKRMNHDAVREFIEACLPGKMTEGQESPKQLLDKRATVEHLVYNGKGASLAGSDVRSGESTAWGVLNGITEYVDHVRPAEAKSPQAKVSANTSALFGLNAQLKALALRKARELVAA